MAWTRVVTNERSGRVPEPVRLISRLPAVLTEREMSKADLSRLCEIPYPIVRRMLRSDVEPSLEQALRVARALGVEIEELFALEARPAPAVPDRAVRGHRLVAGRGAGA